jgi:hypothetical protein
MTGERVVVVMMMMMMIDGDGDGDGDGVDSTKSLCYYDYGTEHCTKTTTTSTKAVCLFMGK